MRLFALICAVLMLAVCAAAPAPSTATPAPTSAAHAPANSAPTAAAAATAATTANTPLIVPNPPDVDARAYILIDFATGQVLADHNADARMQPASLTKLMT